MTSKEMKRALEILIETAQDGCILLSASDINLMKRYAEAMCRERTGQDFPYTHRETGREITERQMRTIYEYRLSRGHEYKSYQHFLKINVGKGKEYTEKACN